MKLPKYVAYCSPANGYEFLTFNKKRQCYENENCEFLVETILQNKRKFVFSDSLEELQKIFKPKR